jgi:hypothetical protein
MNGLCLLDLYRTGKELHLHVDSGFPDDAIVMRQYYDRSTGVYYLVVHSETFESVRDGEEIPLALVVMTTLQNPAQQKEKNKDGKTGAPETEATGEAPADVSAIAQPGAGGPE